VIFYLKCAAYKSTYLLTYLYLYMTKDVRNNHILGIADIDLLVHDATFKSAITIKNPWYPSIFL